MGEVLEGKVNGHGAEPQTIIPAAAAAIAPNGQTVEQMLAQAERSVAFRKGILKLIAANLEPTDVTLYGEGDKQTVHLTKHACKQILGWAGITVQPDSGFLEKRYDGVEGPYIDFELWGTWIRGMQAYRTMGNRSTYDDFYAKRNRYICSAKENGSDEICGATTDYERGCPQHGKVRSIKESYYLPLSEVDIPSIKQAAITNLWNHVVEDAGLKPSKKELLAVGFRFDEVKDRVTFDGDKNKQSSGNSSAATTSSAVKPAASKDAAKPTSAPGNAASTPQAKSTLPKEVEKQSQQLPVGKGIISDAFKNVTRANAQGKGGGKPYVKVVQNGHFLFCYHNSEIETRDGAKNLLDLIVSVKGQFCEFVVSTKQKDGQPMHTIDGARRIGVYEWDEQGQPVVQRREPGDDGYEATDEDIPY